LTGVRLSAASGDFEYSFDGAPAEAETVGL